MRLLCKLGIHNWRWAFSSRPSSTGFQFVIWECRRCESEKTTMRMVVP